uniref:Uncharacterized protein n=1 Tax=Arundo donax TaxID=35708 RepID=A0A0A9HEE7_ARUDO
MHCLYPETLTVVLCQSRASLIAAPADAAMTEPMAGTRKPPAASDAVETEGVAETVTASFMPLAQWPGTLQMK